MSVWDARARACVCVWGGGVVVRRVVDSDNMREPMMKMLPLMF